MDSRSESFVVRLLQQRRWNAKNDLEKGLDETYEWFLNNADSMHG